MKLHIDLFRITVPTELSDDQVITEEEREVLENEGHTDTKSKAVMTWCHNRLISYKGKKRICYGYHPITNPLFMCS